MSKKFKLSSPGTAYQNQWLKVGWSFWENSTASSYRGSGVGRKNEHFAHFVGSQKPACKFKKGELIGNAQRHAAPTASFLVILGTKDSKSLQVAGAACANLVWPARATWNYTSGSIVELKLPPITQDLPRF
ncbi:hypothetical protein [Maritalea myrionectae]|uniref:hypothetical protein n=1 Tax=Maritalea myrionectae TaxID=454601 RepID=UPI000E3B595C|nr:hypothetical protein [Maritalea myrionectae]